MSLVALNSISHIIAKLISFLPYSPFLPLLVLLLVYLSRFTSLNLKIKSGIRSIEVRKEGEVA